MATNSTRPTESVRRAATPPDDVTTALDAIRRIVQALRVSARSAERRLGVSGAQLFVLHALADEPARSLNDLAARTYTHQSSVSVVVDRLAKRRLISRSRSPQDGRRIVLELTPSGRSLLRASPEVAQIRLEATDRLVLASCDLSADTTQPDDASLLHEPPNAAARRLAAHAGTLGSRQPAVLVLAVRTDPDADAGQPASPSRHRPPADGRTRPAGRAPLPLLLGVGALAVVTVAAVGLALSYRPGPVRTAPSALVAAPDMDLAALGLPSADIAATDRRLAQTVRLALAVTAIDSALDRLDLKFPKGDAASIKEFREVRRALLAEGGSRAKQ